MEVVDTGLPAQGAAPIKWQHAQSNWLVICSEQRWASEQRDALNQSFCMKFTTELFLWNALFVTVIVGQIWWRADMGAARYNHILPTFRAGMHDVVCGCALNAFLVVGYHCCACA